MDTELYYGKSANYDYNTIIDMFPNSSIKTVRTSNLPLLAFWKETNKRLRELLNSFKIENTDKYSLCFEYPTSSGGKGKASMTDLMIISDSVKIAVEAKFTEIEKDYESVENWLKKGNNENRNIVLEKWINMISSFSNSELSIENIKNIPYQFLHRTASACYEYNSKQAYVVYQIFSDSQTEGFLQSFIKIIKEAKNIINPNENLKFYIWEIEVEQNIKEEAKDSAFNKIKTENIYEFKKVNDPEQI